MKIKILLIAITFLELMNGCKENPKPKIRYFEYGVAFTLKSNCISGAQATVAVDHQLSFDEIKDTIQTWIGKDGIVKFHVWYLSEITEGEMYALSAPYNCNGHDEYIFDRSGRLRILNQKTNKY